MRADGRIDLDLRATIETDDGHRIALSADGVSVLHEGEPILDLLENVRITTAAATYAWVNARQVWAVGTMNWPRPRSTSRASCNDRFLPSRVIALHREPGGSVMRDRDGPALTSPHTA
jgi:hypothetical protein